MAKKPKEPREIKLTLENVRCFAGAHTVPICPLTLLVGENSTGKTTVLAATSLAFDQGFPMRSDFNKPPFQLGSYDTIATYKGGKYGRDKSFSIGRTGVPRAGITVKATYVARAGEPAVSNILIADTNEQAEVVVELAKDEAVVCLRRNGSTEMEETFTGELPPDPSMFVFYLYMSAREEGSPIADRLRPMVEAVSPGFTRTGPKDRGSLPSSAMPMAPVRSKPERTYSEMSSIHKPEGDHVPYLLSKLDGGEEADGDEVAEELKAFGSSSGLFEEVTPKRLGSEKPSDPFQIQVKGAGPAANLIDVGYGVSQVLPVLVDSVTAPKTALVLIQQPEVHLHPRAQAALGSFFVHLAADEGRHLVVETHSDYIIDRVRMDVAGGKIAPEDVALLYFEKEALESKVYPIHLDKLGNMLDAPRSYRSFFLKEQTAFITGKR